MRADAQTPFTPISDHFKNTRPITPYMPVRTRAGHVAYIWEFDSEKAFGIRVRIIFDKDRHKDISVSETGHYISRNIVHPWDVFNIQQDAWNRNGSDIVAFVHD